jgi:putative lipoprotein
MEYASVSKGEAQPMAKPLIFVASTLAALFVVSSPAWTQGEPAMGVVTGSVSYRQRIALQPEAVVEVSLLDASLTGSPAKVIAQEKIPAAGNQVPIPFRLEYRSAEILPGHSYQVRARITLNGELLFTSTRAYPVFNTPGSPANIEVMLDQVQGRPSPHPAHVLLEDTYWRLVELDGQPLVRSPNSQEAYVLLHAAGETFSGNTGCNRLVGSYVRNGDALRFKGVSSTMMACPGPVMKQEQNMTKALGSTVRFRITGSTLELFDNRQSVAKFEARLAK